MSSVAVSIFVSATVCMLSALFGWWLYRAQRTASALNQLMGAPAMQDMLIDKPGHDEAMQDLDQWTEYVRKVLAPTANSIERFASLANPPFRFLPAFYSRRLIRRVACQSLISIRDDHYMKNYIKRSRKASSSPETTYQEFDSLVKWLRERPL